MGSAMAKPKKKEQRDETTELEWDVAKEPQEKALPDIIDPEPDPEPAAEMSDDAVGPGPAPEAARPQTARRKPQPLPVVSYAVVFVVVALTTAALLIAFT
jgi:hypothetical protein